MIEEVTPALQCDIVGPSSICPLSNWASYQNLLTVVQQIIVCNFRNVHVLLNNVNQKQTPNIFCTNNNLLFKTCITETDMHFNSIPDLLFICLKLASFQWSSESSFFISTITFLCQHFKQPTWLLSKWNCLGPSQCCSCRK